MGGSDPIPLEANSTPDVDATATVFAQNVANARSSTSPIATPNIGNAPDSPLPDTNATPVIPVSMEGGTNWLLWGGLGLIPILLIGWFILQPPAREE